MANPNRKMATLRKISSITPIEGADRIELAHLGGWQVVIEKGSFHEGDIVLYFEIDTFLPTERGLTPGAPSPYAFLAERSTKTMVIDGEEVVGHVLKTIRLRKVYSQGLILDPHTLFDIPDEVLEDLFEQKADMTEACGVCEYYRPLEPGQVGIIGRYDAAIAPRTDAERIQNIDEDIFDLIKKSNYFVSLKVDGTSMTMLFDPRKNAIRVFSHNNELDTAVGMGKTSFDAADEAGLVTYCNAHPAITVQYELCGPKIQSDRLALGKHRIFVFSMYDMSNQCYLDPYEELADVPTLKDYLTPKLDIDLSEFDTTTSLIDYIDGFKGHVTKNRLDEGIVVHILDTDDRDKLFDALGSQMQMKVINNKYLLKE